MSEWRSFQLGELASFRKGINYTSSDYGDRDSGRPFITIKSFVKGGGYEPNGLKYINGEFGNLDQLLAGDVLFSVTDLTRAGDIVGSPLQVPCFSDNSYFVASMDCMKIEPRRDVCDRDFLFQRMMLSDIRRQMVGYSAGSTVLHLDTKKVPLISACFPKSVKEQQKIARVLQTIDRTIEKTEALIDKYQQIKAGLMHDLFTRGIDADGHLRPPREQAPHLYQHTPIGWIPKEWGCGVLSRLLAPVANNFRSGPFGSSLLKSELVESGIPFLGIDNIYTENFKDDFRRFVSESKFLELNKYSVRPRDVVITIMGTVGRCAVIPEDLGRALSSKHLWTMTFDPAAVIPELVCWQLNHAPWVRSWFRKETQGGIMDAIQSHTLRTLVLPIIPMEEQKHIFRRYVAINNFISSEEENLVQLEKQKSGLMHDLLTGKVRVPMDEPAAEAEAAHG
jgi:type I restriction enzyme S subunit